MSKKLSEKDFWDWLEQGINNDWITPTFCSTHDGGYEYQTDEERQEWEDGGDPCMTVTRVKYLG
jgi:hypothetical protein